MPEEVVNLAVSDAEALIVRALENSGVTAVIRIFPARYNQSELT